MKEWKLIILSVVITAILLAGLIYLSKQNSSSSNVPTANSVLSAEQTIFDFGTVSMAKGDVFTEFKIQNAGPEPLIITKIYTSCMCTKATLVKNDGRRVGPFGMLGHGYVPAIKEQLTAGEEATVEVVFDPRAHGPAGLGRIEREIILDNNAGAPLVLTVAANVAP